MREIKRMTRRYLQNVLCSIEDCGEKHHAHGYCRGHYWNYHRTGNPHKVNGRQRPPNLSNEEILEYYLSQAVRDGECLISPMRTDGHGYPQVRLNKVSKKLHRLIFELANGVELPMSVKVRKSCENKKCIELSHMYLVEFHHV